MLIAMQLTGVLSLKGVKPDLTPINATEKAIWRMGMWTDAMNLALQVRNATSEQISTLQGQLNGIITLARQNATTDADRTLIQSLTDLNKDLFSEIQEQRTEDHTKRPLETSL